MGAENTKICYIEKIETETEKLRLVTKNKLQNLYEDIIASKTITEVCQNTESGLISFGKNTSNISLSSLNPKSDRETLTQIEAVDQNDNGKIDIFEAKVYEIGSKHVIERHIYPEELATINEEFIRFID